MLDSEHTRLLFNSLAFVITIGVLGISYWFGFRYLKRAVSKTVSQVDDIILELFKIPVLCLVFWIPLKIYMQYFLQEVSFIVALEHINNLLLIFTIAWLLVQTTKAISFIIQKKLNLITGDNLSARKSLTQVKVFQHIINTILIICSIAAALLTFREARTIGLSLLTSAGILGIIIGFAAQKSIGMILSGIQLAITQPIRIDDVVIVEGEWGRIEEITLTYVVVKIWDERRMVLPVNYFLEKPFQNWTRNSAEITGTIFLYVDYSLPVDEIRAILPSLLSDNLNWDKRIVNVQVTNTSENFMEVRILLSSADASQNWDLRAEIREKLIQYINSKHPGSLARIRIKQL